VIPANNQSAETAMKNNTLKFPMHKHLKRKPKLHPRSLKTLNEISRNLINEGLEHMVPEKARLRMIAGLKKA
jgi:hypothetical protein